MAEAQFCDEPATTESPDVLYDRKWAGCLIAAALGSVDCEYKALGKAVLFNEIKPLLWGARGASGYAEIALRLGSTEGAIKVATFRLRRRFGEQLRAEVAKTVLRPEDVEDELRHLLAAFSG